MNATRTNYILVDYENVQPSPEELALLKGRACKVKVFVGAKRSTLPVPFVTAMQSLGSDGEYVLLKASGNNALDFHIAFSIGLIAAQDPTQFFHIISKDKDYDSLIENLKTTNVFVRRSESIADIPYFQRLVPVTMDVLLNTVIERLKEWKQNKPGTEQALRNSLPVLSGKELLEEQRDDLLIALCKHGVVKVVDGKLEYTLQTSA